MSAVIAFLVEHGLELVGGVVLVLNGVIAIATLIPGEQPEKFLRSVVDVIGKISRK